MQKYFETELGNLKTNVIKVASIVDEMVEQSFIALETSDLELCKKIVARDREVDAYDNLINTQCEIILALFQPFAVDLRYLISAMMINHQLERCGDIAVNIAQRTKHLTNQQKLIRESEILIMGKQARLMVKNSIDSFINKDIELASTIGKQDDSVDAYNKSIFRFAIEKMKFEPTLIEPSAHLLILSRQIERLADHATNIAEDVIFMINAEFVTHKFKLNKFKGK
jgi:phosphate transport system protein